MTRSAASIFLLCMATFLVNGRPHPEVDCVAAPFVAWSLVRFGSYDVRHYATLERHVGTAIRERSDGAWASMRTPGSAFAVVPLVAPIAFARQSPPSDATMNQLGKLAASLAVAGAAVLFFFVCRRLAPTAAWPATILLALGTCLCSVASQAIWMHGPAVFWLCCALFLLTHADRQQTRFVVAAGFALGLAVLTRPTTAFFALATVGALLAERRWRGALGLIVGGIVPAIILLHYNWVNFGSPLLGGYENDNWHESPPLWLGLGGLLVAPSRGLFVYSPALLLAIPGAWRLLRRGQEQGENFKTLLLAWLAAALVTLLFFARWHDWRGGWCYGPRFLCEAMPILCLLFALAYEAMQQNWQRRAAVGLVALSVSVHVIGLLGYSGYDDWHRRHQLPDQGRCLFALHDTQIEAHATALLRKWTNW